MTPLLPPLFSLPGAGALDDALVSIGGHESAWTKLQAGAKAAVYMRVAGQGGNATADPSFRRITAQFR